MDANLSLGTHAFANSARHKVDGSQVSIIMRGVGVSSLSCPETGDTCELGDRILVFGLWTDSNRRRIVGIDVTGTPQIAIAVGTQTRYADYDAAKTVELGASGPGVVYFSYFVQSADRDADGIHIPPNGLRLNGGTIKVAGSQRDAPLKHAGSPVATDTKVNGGRSTAPSARNVRIVSSPASGDTYGFLENIRVRVEFSRAVVVTGTPRLALTIGSQTRQASYASGTGTEFLEFGYQVQVSDADADGIGIGANALTLNGGTIALQGDAATDASLALGRHAIVNAAAHKVDASQGTPRVGGLVLGSPPVGDTFERGRHDCRNGDVQRGRGRDGRAAAGADDRIGHAPGRLRLGHGHGVAGVPLRGGAGGRGR